MFYSNPADAGTDASALQTLADTYGERATKLPPVALVIAAYNEEGAVGPVVEKLPRTVCGLAAEVKISVQFQRLPASARSGSPASMLSKIHGNPVLVRGLASPETHDCWVGQGIRPLPPRRSRQALSALAERR